MAQLTKTVTCTYDAPLDDVLNMLLDTAFREKVCEAQGLIAYAVEITSTGEQTQVSIDKKQAMAGMPSAVLKVVGDTVDIVQREMWTDGGATVNLTIPGKPGTGAGHVTLAADGERTTETVAMEVTVNIPLLGGKLATVIADQFVEAMESEFSVGHAWLEGDR